MAKKNKENNVWDFKQIRKYAWDTVFHKGWKPWLWLVLVCFFFNFIGALNPLQSSGIDLAYSYFDKMIGYKDERFDQNVEYLKQFVLDSKLMSKADEEDRESVGTLVDEMASGNSWVIRALSANAAYFQRNPGEVFANLALIAIVILFLKFFIQNVLLIGLCRYCMEFRQQKEVRMRRVMAPLHLSNIPNLIRVMLCYNISIFLWSMLFFIPGIIKTYEYSMVSYILAENPNLKWREAKKLSKQMTRGYKWKMFLTDLSFIYIWILQIIPFAGLLVATPLAQQLGVEFYFTLRNRADVDTSMLPEKAFADAPYVKKANRQKKNIISEIESPEYVLADINTTTAHKKGRFRFDYSPTDIVFLFFCFCLIGWIWEVSYEFVNSHVLVNRGTMYGPWIPIYGFGGLAIVILLSRFKDNKLKLFGMTMVICAILEYLASFALEFIFNSSYWDYKKMFMNVNGRICLAGLLAFGIGGLFGVYVAAPAISRFVNRFAKKTQYIAAAVLCVLFVVDLICCACFGFNTGASVGGKIA
ncbi:MAG: DUF975 family protein [Clostridiales bacterium]|nr:DUF975 family protein [Clostridiales bacterium]